MNRFTLFALLGITSAQKAYSADLKCGMCIKSGFNFCVQATDGQVFEPGVKPVATCCENETCTEASDASYTCSTTYGDLDYALTMCPQRKEKCGSKQDLDLGEGETEQVEVVDLEEGETCTYKVKSNCGSPAFKVEEGATEGVDITYIEFEDGEVEKTGKGKGKGKSPKSDMPSRDQSFEDSGDQGQYGGQKKPPKKNKNGKIEDGEYMDGLDEFGQPQEGGGAGGGGGGGRRPGGGGGGRGPGGGGQGGEEMDSTRGGYGKPTKGEYDASEGGYKTFGTEGQGENKKGMKGDGEKCAGRKMYVTVTATEDLVEGTSSARRVLQASSKKVVLEFGAFTFEDALVEEGAMKILGSLTVMAMALIASV